MKNWYKAGDIVLVAYPFTDLKKRKVRPALVLRDQDDLDILVTPISTTVNASREDIVIQKKDYTQQALPITSCVRWKKLFTLHHNLVLQKASQINNSFLKTIKQKIVDFINSSQ